MGRPAPMHLSEDERDHVQVFVRRGKANARTLTRAKVLLKSDEGWTDAEIAETLDISEQTIRNIRQRFRAGGVEARSVRPITQSHLSQKFLSLVIFRRCHSALYRCSLHNFLREVSHGFLARVQGFG